MAHEKEPTLNRVVASIAELQSELMDYEGTDKDVRKAAAGVVEAWRVYIRDLEQYRARKRALA